jgi:hypothetical protein
MQYLLPLALVDSSYGLLAVKMEMDRTIVIDYSNQALFNFEEDFHDTELQREALLVKQEFSFVLQQAAPDRDSQLVEWPEQENIHVSPRWYYFNFVMHISACANIAITIWCFFVTTWTPDSKFYRRWPICMKPSGMTWFITCLGLT